MAPFSAIYPRNLPIRRDGRYPHGRESMVLSSVVLEGWSQGVLFGGLVVLILFTIANMRRQVLLHWLIMVELTIALGHCTFIFFPDPIFGWYLSSTAALLYMSYIVHNIVSWIKIKPFLPPWGSKLFIGTIILVAPYWVAEIFFNFQYFNELGNYSFVQTRPWEAPMRDGWWIFTTCRLIYSIKHTYDIPLSGLIKQSPRFGVLIISMLISIVFIFTDIAVTVHPIGGADNGVNPFWKFSLIFKCASDVIFLDNFKKVLDSLLNRSIRRFDNRCDDRMGRWPPATQFLERIPTTRSDTTRSLHK